MATSLAFFNAFRGVTMIVQQNLASAVTTYHEHSFRQGRMLQVQTVKQGSMNSKRYREPDRSPEVNLVSGVSSVALTR